MLFSVLMPSKRMCENVPLQPRKSDSGGSSEQKSGDFHNTIFEAPATFVTVTKSEKSLDSTIFEAPSLGTTT